MTKPLEMLKVRDKADSYVTHKKNIPDVPFRLLLIAKSGQGKSSCALNLILRDNFYNKDFHGENIFVVSGSLKNDNKLRQLVISKEIPTSNQMLEYDEDKLEAIYEFITDVYLTHEEDKKKPPHFLLFLDDMSFGGNLRKRMNGVMSKIFCNGRHINLSVILTSQRYSDLLTTCRENASAMFVWSCSDRQLKTIADDVNILDDRRQFRKLFRDNTKGRDFFVVDYTSPGLYRNSKFEQLLPE